MGGINIDFLQPLRWVSEQFTGDPDLGFIDDAGDAIREADIDLTEVIEAGAKVAVLALNPAAAIYAVPAIDAASTLAQGGSVEDAIKGAAISVVTAGAGDIVNNLTGNLIADGITSVAGEALSETAVSTIADAAAEGLVSATVELVSTGDTSLETIITGAASSVVGSVFKDVDIDTAIDTSSLDGVIEVVKSTVDELEKATGIEVDAAAAAEAAAEVTRVAELAEQGRKIDLGEQARLDEQARYDIQVKKLVGYDATPELVQSLGYKSVDEYISASKRFGLSISKSGPQYVADAANAVVNTVANTAATAATAVAKVINIDETITNEVTRNVVTDALVDTVTQLVVTGEVDPTQVANAAITTIAASNVLGNENVSTGNEVVDQFIANTAVSTISEVVATGKVEDLGATMVAVADDLAAPVLKEAIDNTAVGNAINNTVDQITGNDEDVKAAAAAVNDAADEYEKLKAGYDSTVIELQNLVNKRRELVQASADAQDAYLASLPMSDGSILAVTTDGPELAAARAAETALIEFNKTYDTKFSSTAGSLRRYSDAAKDKLSTYRAAVTAYDTSVDTLATAKTQLTADFKPIKDGVTELVATSINPNISAELLQEATGLDDKIAAYEKFLVDQKEVNNIIKQNAVDEFMGEVGNFGKSDISTDTDGTVTAAPITKVDADKTAPTLSGPTEVSDTPTVDTDKDAAKLGDNMTPAQFEILGIDKNLKDLFVGAPLSKFDLQELDRLGENVNQRNLAFINNVGLTGEGTDIKFVGKGSELELAGDLQKDMDDAQFFKYDPLGMLFGIVQKTAEPFLETDDENVTVTDLPKIITDNAKDIFTEFGGGVVNATGTMAVGVDQAIIQGASAFSSNLKPTYSTNPEYDVNAEVFLSGMAGDGSTLAETDKTIKDSAFITRAKNHDPDKADGGVLTDAGEWIKGKSDQFKELFMTKEAIKEGQSAGFEGNTPADLQLNAGVKAFAQATASEVGEEVTELALANTFKRNPALLAIVSGLSAGEAIDGSIQQSQQVIKGLLDSGELQNSKQYQDILKLYGNDEAKAESFFVSEVVYNSIAYVAGVGFTDAFFRGVVGQTIGEGAQGGIEGWSVLNAAANIFPDIPINTFENLAGNIATEMVIGGSTSAVMGTANAIASLATNGTYDTAGIEGVEDGSSGGSIFPTDIDTTDPVKIIAPTYDAESGAKLLTTLDNFGADVSSAAAINNTLANLGVVDPVLTLGLVETANERAEAAGLDGFISKNDIENALGVYATFDVTDADIDTLYARANTSTSGFDISEIDFADIRRTDVRKFIEGYEVEKREDIRKKAEQAALDQTAADKAIQDARDEQTLKDAQAAKEKAVQDALDAEQEENKLAEQARLSEEAETARLAEEAEQARLTEEAEQARLTEEAEQARLAEEAKLAEEAEQEQAVQDAADAKDALDASVETTEIAPIEEVTEEQDTEEQDTEEQDTEEQDILEVLEEQDTEEQDILEVLEEQNTEEQDTEEVTEEQDILEVLEETTRPTEEVTPTVEPTLNVAEDTATLVNKEIIDAVTEFTGKAESEVTDADVDFLVDAVALESVVQDTVTEQDNTQEIINLITQDQNIDVTKQIDPTIDPTVDPTVETKVDPTVDPTVETKVDPTVDPTVETKVDPTVDPTVETEVDPTVDTKVETEVDTQVETEVDTQVEAELEEEEEEEEEMLARLLPGYRGVSVKAPDLLELPYQYDISGSFYSPQQGILSGTPYGPRRLPVKKSARGGQVQNENDRLLRIIGEM
jgi:hypothetical protein